MGQDTGLTLQINSREQLVALLQGIFDTTQTTATTGTEEIVDVLEVDDYDYGNFEDADDEDYERLVELLGNLKQSFGDGRTDDLINLLFEDEEESETRVTPLGATQKLRQIDRLILFFKTPSPETESAFNEAIRALPPWKLPKLSEILELRQKELNPEAVVSALLPSSSSSSEIPSTSTATATAAIAEGSQVVSSPSTISFYSDVFSRSIKAVNALIAEKGKDELNPPVGLLSRGGKKPTGDVIGRVLGISKVAKSSSISATIGFGSGIVSSLSNPDNRNAVPVNSATSDPHQVLEKYSRFGRKVTKQNLIEAGLFAADQPDNPIELKWSDIDTKVVPEGMKHPLVLIADGYLTEMGKDYADEISSVTTLLYLQDAEKTIPFYEKYFYGKEHINFLAMGEGNTGGVCISVELTKGDTARALIRMKRGEDRVLIPASQKPKELLKTIKSGYPEFERLKLNHIKDPEFPNELLSMEKKLMFKTYKWGVLYCKAGQTDEVDMFQNVDESPGYLEFLEFLGQRVKLQGWTGFRGGLDVKNNATGLFSVYTTHRNFEIMYHVSTLLPFSADDTQQLERKRHLGNDIVVIIYKEGDTPYAPTTIRSEFNHVFCVVQKEDTPPDAPTRYRVAFTCKNGVKPFYPLLTSGSYEKGDAFRELLLTKLVNAERMAFYAPDFAQKMLRTRKMMLEDIHGKFCKEG